MYGRLCTGGAMCMMDRRPALTLVAPGAVPCSTPVGAYQKAAMVPAAGSSTGQWCVVVPHQVWLSGSKPMVAWVRGCTRISTAGCDLG